MAASRETRAAAVEVVTTAAAFVALAAAFAHARTLPDAVALTLFGALLVWAENAAVLLPTKVALSPSFMVVVASLAAFNGRGSVLGAGLVGLCGGLSLEMLRQRRFRTLLFNCSQYVLAGAAAALAEGALRDHAWPHPAALIVASLVFAAVNVGLVLPAVAIESGVPPAAVWADMAPALPNYLAFGLLGTFIGQLYHRLGPLSVVILVTPLVIARSVFSAFLRLREAYKRLESLYGFTRSLGHSLDVDSAVRTTLADVQRLLQARLVELVTQVGPGETVRTVLTSGGEMVTTPVARDDARLFELGVVAAGAPLAASAATADPALAEAMTQRGMKEVMVVPVHGHDGTVGAMLVADRTGAGAPFSAEDLQLLEALANHAGVAFQNGRLVERLRWESQHDALTRLANRTSFHAAVERVVRERRPGEMGAIMLMDLDRFKEVNDTLGHHSGDVLVQAIAERLTSQLAGVTAVARLGGDEFAVLFSDLHDLAGVRAAADRLLAILDRPFVVGDLNLDVDGSVGVALYPIHGTDAVSLLQRADVAVYQAKQQRGGWELYNPDRDVHTPRRLMLAADLRSALQREELAVHYQPKADLVDGRITGVEALLRWTHAEHGVVPPDEFIPLAEHTGLIRPLTQWVMGAAIHQCGAWRRRGMALHVAVNLSMRALVDADLPDLVARLLAEAGVPPSGLVLEITESTIMADPSHSIAVLERLSGLGITLSIDDFGTGYSSLSYLKRLPVGEVKVDRSFVMNMGSDMADVAIVRSTVDLARNLGLRVVAEGVEDSETWAQLGALGCHSAQGYYLARPMPALAFEQWLLGYRAEVSN